jgi:hypothetical protein
MATLNDLKRKARQARRKMQAAHLIEADLTEWLNDDGVTSVKVTDSDANNLVWAYVQGQGNEPVQVYNISVQPRNHAPVWVRQLADGTFEVERLRSRDGSEFYGEAAASMNIGELIGELMATVWSARNLKPGRARLSELGGMYVYIEEFFYSGGKFAGDNLDLTDYVPTTTDKQVWAVIYYDPVSAALGVTTGTEYDLVYTMNEIDLGAIALAPQYIPLAGVILTEGDTALSGSSTIVARQPWIDAPINSEQFFPIEITDTRTIPANRQIAVRRLAVTGSGVLNVYGVLDIF